MHDSLNRGERTWGNDVGTRTLHKFTYPTTDYQSLNQEEIISVAFRAPGQDTNDVDGDPLRTCTMVSPGSVLRGHAL
jgi:hypothetical protein